MRMAPPLLSTRNEICMDAQNTTEMEDPQSAKRVNKNLVLNAYNSNSDKHANSTFDHIESLK